uniref:Uncharacterized protein n=1 Tax=Romanomermis culicivorax TaxID=13658 RepID=A0A915JGC0_ROMCU
MINRAEIPLAKLHVCMWYDFARSDLVIVLMDMTQICSLEFGTFYFTTTLNKNSNMTKCSKFVQYRSTGNRAKMQIDESLKFPITFDELNNANLSLVLYYRKVAPTKAPGMKEKEQERRKLSLSSRAAKPHHSSQAIGKLTINLRNVDVSTKIELYADVEKCPDVKLLYVEGYYVTVSQKSNEKRYFESKNKKTNAVQAKPAVGGRLIEAEWNEEISFHMPRTCSYPIALVQKKLEGITTVLFKATSQQPCGTNWLYKQQTVNRHRLTDVEEIANVLISPTEIYFVQILYFWKTCKQTQEIIKLSTFQADKDMNTSTNNTLLSTNEGKIVGCFTFIYSLIGLSLSLLILWSLIKTKRAKMNTFYILLINQILADGLCFVFYIFYVAPCEYWLIKSVPHRFPEENKNPLEGTMQKSVRDVRLLLDVSKKRRLGLGLFVYIHIKEEPHSRRSGEALHADIEEQLDVHPKYQLTQKLIDHVMQQCIINSMLLLLRYKIEPFLNTELNILTCLKASMDEKRW